MFEEWAGEIKLGLVGSGSCAYSLGRNQNIEGSELRDLVIYIKEGSPLVLLRGPYSDKDQTCLAA